MTKHFIDPPVNSKCIEEQCFWLNQLSNGIVGTNGEYSAWCMKKLTCRNNSLFKKRNPQPPEESNE